jgi:hypothetical protein
MAMIEPVIVSLAVSNLAGGLHPNVAPQNCVRPYGVYLEVVSPTENTLSDGIPIQQSIIQITVWDVTYGGAKTSGDALAASIDGAFQSGALVGVQRSRRSQYDTAANLHGFLYEFSFWYH